MYLKFFVEKGLEDLAGFLSDDFEVRKEGRASPEEIAFFQDRNMEGFYFAAHKIMEEDIPEEVKKTPFLVKVGRNWTLEGLFHVLSGYAFFKIPLLGGSSDEEVLMICKNMELPWGGFPQGKRSRSLLLKWLRKADKCYPRDTTMEKEMENYFILKKLAKKVHENISESSPF